MIEIREATLDDVSGIIRVRQLALENELEAPLTEAMLAHALQGVCKAYVADFNDEIIGFVLANPKNKSIWGLFVFEPFQGQGIGKALLDQAVSWLWQQRSGLFRRKIKRIRLTTKQGSKAEQFYQKCGWQPLKAVANHEIEYVLYNRHR